MNIDFSLVLFVLVLVSGGIWLMDIIFFASKRNAAHAETGIEEDVKEPIVLEYAKFIFPVVLIVFLLRGFIAEPFRIPSGSMLPTLEVGDFILVNKFAYGVRIPVWNKKVLGSSVPQRGDVVVFRYPEDPRIDYIKRIIGVPGDEVAYYNKVLYINGKELSQTVVGDYAQDGSYVQYSRFKEELDELHYDILKIDNVGAGDFVIRVPENNYFAMGDNRDNSRDSRAWGFVPDENLVGEAFLIWMNWSSEGGLKWQRLGTIIE
ncbi:MAG: signal peptidase I [Gammaproteobacteria bacterium]